jgi:hypothetical protein
MGERSNASRVLERRAEGRTPLGNVGESGRIILN